MRRRKVRQVLRQAVQPLELRDGDILAVIVKERCPSETLHKIGRTINEMLPRFGKDVKAMVFSGDIDLRVVRPVESSAAGDRVERLRQSDGTRNGRSGGETSVTTITPYPCHCGSCGKPTDGLDPECTGCHLRRFYRSQPLPRRIERAILRLVFSIDLPFLKLNHRRYSSYARVHNVRPVLNGGPPPHDAYAMFSLFGWGLFWCYMREGDRRVYDGNQIVRVKCFGRVKLERETKPA